ncbi:torsin-1B [Trichonephila clavipes]|nr:torsin-1B [Trichonephila clavipes]
MTVNLKKTTCQFFTLNRQPFSPQLVYNGMPVQQSDVSIYLGCALDNKLKWTKHAELVVSKATKRLSILKRLTGVKWGCNRDTLNTTYKTYIQPVLNYCNEVLISASENPFTNIIEKNAAILFNRLIRLPNNSFWRDYDSDGGRNLKTQKGFIQCVRENIQYKVINDVPFELLSFANPLDYAILDIRLDLVLNVRKRDLSRTALHAIALETINTRFPPEEWLHIYTDGSLLDFAQGAGIGVFSHLFSFYLHAGPLTTHFDGEVEAIHIALQQLAVHLPPIERAVILSDSTSALQALSNYNENNCLRVQNCRELLGKIKGKIVFQWVPSHCGLWGNERADFLAKKGTGILPNFRRDLTLHSAKLEIKRIFRESFRLTASRVARDTPWSTLCKKSHGIPSSPRAAAVAKFRLLTGHDCLCAHLFRFNLVTSPICVLCDTGQDMTAAHLEECSALNDLNCIDRLRKEIEEATKKCERSLFIFDEVDKIAPGVLDALKPYVDYHENVNGLDYRRNVFIFLSDAGGNNITGVALKFWAEGVEREYITLKDVEPVISKNAFNEPGGLWRSELVKKDLIDVYVPFLPLEKKHVKKCILAELHSRNLRTDAAIVDRIANQLLYVPEEVELFSVSGCKKVNQKVDLFATDEF